MENSQNKDGLKRMGTFYFHQNDLINSCGEIPCPEEYLNDTSRFVKRTFQEHEEQRERTLKGILDEWKKK
jgi:hypothetical protein